MLTARERRQLTTDWNATDVPCEQWPAVHRLFEAQVRATPDAVAVAGDETLSYAALNERANRLARHLAGRGLGAERLVGVCLERSADLVVALLAVLKSGAAYVPLDPSHPPERLRFQATDARPSLILTQERLEPHLAGLPAPCLRLDLDRAALGRGGRGRPS